MNNAALLFDKMAIAMGKGPFKVSRDVALADGGKAEVAASRTYFSWKGLVIISQHIIVRHIDNATQDDARALFDSGFRFGKSKNRVPLLRGLQFGYMIIPVLVGESPDGALLQAVSLCPAKHWSLFEYPVVVDLSTNQTICFNGKAAWGGFFFSDMRKVIETYIIASLSNKSNAGDAIQRT